MSDKSLGIQHHTWWSKINIKILFRINIPKGLARSGVGRGSYQLEKSLEFALSVAAADPREKSITPVERVHVRFLSGAT